MILNNLRDSRDLFKNIKTEEFIDAKGIAHRIATRRVPYTNNRGEEFFVGAIQDCTELLGNREQLKQYAKDLAKLYLSEKKITVAKLRLEQANNAKSEFLSSMSHELRTPLNVIMGFADLLKGQFYGPLNEKQAGYVAGIDSSSQHLLALINDLLDMAKIDAGALEMKSEAIPAGHFVAGTVDMMKNQFREKKLTVETFVSPAVQSFKGDLLKIKQILINLISNAVKYTLTGGNIRIAVEKETGCVRISVCDNGLGIRSDELEKIFIKFHQADRIRDGQMCGTVIGLALARELVELHGGEIGVESKLHLGSTFWFTLPQEDAGAPVPELNEKNKPTDALKVASRRRILVAEDNEKCQVLIRDMLVAHGYRVSVAKNGLEALDLARTIKPELILMDIRMPQMGGYEATRRLREMKDFFRIPIIALTASTGREVIERQKKAGCTDHLAKPVQSRQLLDVLGHYLQ